MKAKLNDTYIARLKHKEERYDIRDVTEPGLMMRVGKKHGQKQWYTFVYRGPKRVMVRIGAFPTTNTKEARAAAIAAKAAGGVRSSERIITVADLFAEYRVATEPKRRSWLDVQKAWDGWARDFLGHVRLNDLTVHHGRDLRAHISKASTELRANSVIRYIRPMFSWAEDESLMETNPWSGLRAKVVAQPRDRVLNESEWLALWASTETDPMGGLVRFLMLSAQRVGNVRSMRWDEIEGDIWTIPREKFKATKVSAQKAHEVPLSRDLRTVINARPKMGPYVFGVTGERPVSFGSRQKNRIGKAAQIDGWVVHDIRRTAATRMTGAKVERFIVARILGHADSDVTSRYDQTLYREEKRAALETLALTILPSSEGIAPHSRSR